MFLPAPQVWTLRLEADKKAAVGLCPAGERVRLKPRSSIL